MTKKKWAIAAASIAVIIAGIFAYAWKYDFDQAETVRNSTIETEEATIAYIKSGLDLYYKEKGRYPHELSELSQSFKDSGVMQDIKARKFRILGNSEDTKFMADFKYELRGDSRGYRLSYTNVRNKKVIVEGDYERSYH